MLQVLETLHLMCIYLYFYHISLQILNCIYKKFKNGKIPYSYLPSLLGSKVLAGTGTGMICMEQVFC
jgi:hypothetical protein